MANLRRRGSSLFPGLLLLFVGLLLLLHNYRGLGIVDVLGHWWPLILIFWGAVKLYERMAASRSGDPGAAKITAGEVFLVLGLLSLLGIVVAAEYFRGNIPGHFREWGNSFDFDVAVPKKASLTIRNEKGDITVADMAKPVSVANGVGDVEIRGTNGDVSIDTRKSDIKISDTKGSIKISGRGGEINVSGATGGLTIEGEFYGAIRADKVAKGVRFISQRTDLTLTQLAGHMEASPGNLEIFDAPGNLNVRSQDDITLENAGGKVKVDNRRGNVEVRFSVPPKPPRVKAPPRPEKSEEN